MNGVVGMDFDDFEATYGGQAVRDAVAGADLAMREFAPPEDADAAEIKLPAQPFVWRDPATIPRRQFLYGFELRRRQISVMAAPGASGKTTLKIGRAICMALGRDLLGHRVWNGPHTCWLWNLEDEMEEVEKTVHAFLKLWNIDPADLADRLYINGADSVGANGFKLAVEDNFGGFRLQRPVSEALIFELKDRGIDYLDVDPFVSSHAVDENSNQAIDAVSKEWLRIAHEANCAVGLAHHLRKTREAEFTAQDARGAGAVINAGRSCLILQKMTAKQAEEFRIEECDRKRYFSVYDDKNNKAPPADKAEWYEFVGIGLGNADVGSEGPEDNIGAVQRWYPPDLFAEVSTRDLYNIQREIDSNPLQCRKSPKANDWVGKLVAGVLGKNLDSKGEAQIIERMIRTWLSNGSLRTVMRDDPKSRHEYEFVGVGKWAEL